MLIYVWSHQHQFLPLRTYFFSFVLLYMRNKEKHLIDKDYYLLKQMIQFVLETEQYKAKVQYPRVDHICDI